MVYLSNAEHREQNHGEAVSPAEDEATSRTTRKQLTKALLCLYLLTGFGHCKGTHHELDTSFYDLQGRVKGPVLYNRKGHFSLFSDPMGLSNLQHNQKGFRVPTV